MLRGRLGSHSAQVEVRRRELKTGKSGSTGPARVQGRRGGECIKCPRPGARGWNGEGSQVGRCISNRSQRMKEVGLLRQRQSGRCRDRQRHGCASRDPVAPTGQLPSRARGIQEGWIGSPVQRSGRGGTIESKVTRKICDMRYAVFPRRFPFCGEGLRGSPAVQKGGVISRQDTGGQLATWVCINI